MTPWFSRFSPFYRQRIFLGLLALVFFLINLYFWIGRGVPTNFLWACHLGTLAVGFGLIFRFPLLNAVGVLWLGLGNVMWLLYMLGGGEVFPTSVLTHVGGIIIGIVGVRRIGLPGFSWLWAVVLLALLQRLSRWLTPEPENINLSFRVHQGWETLFPSFFWYSLMLLFVSMLSFIIMELLLKKYVVKPIPKANFFKC